jgi:DNA-directed RNA polymerase specialized sigma24 family protein
MSYVEIGEKLGMSPKSVDNAVQRARRKLKEVIA